MNQTRSDLRLKCLKRWVQPRARQRRGESYTNVFLSITMTLQSSGSFSTSWWTALCPVFDVGGCVSWVKRVHMVGFGLATVGGTKNNNGVCGAMHRERKVERGREGDVFIAGPTAGKALAEHGSVDKISVQDHESRHPERWPATHYPCPPKPSPRFPLCENYAVVPLFFLYFSLFIARPPVLGTTLNCIIMLSRLLRQHVARAYGQDTLYWL